MKKVLVVGGGFAGVKVALELSKHDAFQVQLLSDRADFYYYPTMYHTATGGKISQSRISLNELFANQRVTILKGTAAHLDRKKKQINTKEGKTHGFDILVLALGSVPNYFGIKGIEEYSFSIKTPEEAARFKLRLHEQLNAMHKPDLNYVIVGGGPTGIELAGVLPSYLKEVMAAHCIKHRAVHVDLIEAAPQLVPRMPKSMGRAIRRRLRRLGVKLYLGQTVEGMSADDLMVNGKPIQSHNVVWTAGIANHPFFKKNNFALNERGKVSVDDYLQAEPDIYVVGDNADTQYSGMAQTALHDAVSVSHNLVREAHGHSKEAYKPKRPIYVIPVGPHWAAVLWGKVQIYGFLGWLMRLAADLVAFKDYEPWWKAGKQWMREFQVEDDCPTCCAPRK